MMSSFVLPPGDAVAAMQTAGMVGCIAIAARIRAFGSELLQRVCWICMASGFGVAAASRLFWHEDAAAEPHGMFFSRIAAMALILTGLLAMVWAVYFTDLLRRGSIGGDGPPYDRGSRGA